MIGRPAIVVMGPSGCGKTSVGRGIASKLDGVFIDADSLHPDANIQKMRSGQPLADRDRVPWLEAVGTAIAPPRDHVVVVACSALKVAYRSILRRSAPDAVFALLDCPLDELEARVSSRPDHFMPASLIRTQLEDLEPLGAAEHGFTIDARLPLETVTRLAIERMRALLNPHGVTESP